MTSPVERLPCTSTSYAAPEIPKTATAQMWNSTVPTLAAIAVRPCQRCMGLPRYSPSNRSEILFVQLHDALFAKDLALLSKLASTQLD